MAQLEPVAGVLRIPREEWNSLVGAESPFLEWEWLASLEEAGVVGEDTGWLPRPLVARDADRLVAACPVYSKAHSEGEFVFDWSWADAAERAGIAYYPKLLVGVPFTPVTGSRLLVANGADRAVWVGRLAAALRAQCVARDYSGVHVNFCRRDEIEALESQGFLLRVGLQYHWHNAGYRRFEDYLARLRHKRRNQVQRERRRLRERGVVTRVVTGAAIDDALFPELFRCYAATADAHVWGRRYLNRRFFDLLRDRFRERLCVVVAELEGRLVAAALNVAKGDTLYGRYWGALRRIPDLHFDVCYYAAIEHCISTGIRRFEPGAGGGYKFVRGFDAVPTYSLHFLTEPRLAGAVERFLSVERLQAGRALDELRVHSALKPAQAR